jgi:hypothetical protein
MISDRHPQKKVSAGIRKLKNNRKPSEDSVNLYRTKVTFAVTQVKV